MYKDLYGKTRQKLGLHTHTTVSDGKLTPEEAARVYREAGYDAIALTDHWKYGISRELSGLKIISGAEYNVGDPRTEEGVYHIVALFTDIEPDLTKDLSPQQIIDGIHGAGGLAVLAHPAWSLNTPEMIMALEGVDATEIYNTVSEKGESFRADSSIIVDMIIPKGRNYPLFASDDTHYYGGVDNCKAFIMVESDTLEDEALVTAIKEKKFYASQGPEIHLERAGEKMIVRCSPCEHVYFASNRAWSRRSTHGENITYAEYNITEHDLFIRAFCIDKNGKKAWTNAVIL